MKKSAENNDKKSDLDKASSKSELEFFFNESLQEMYYSENAIANEFGNIQNKIFDPKLKEILEAHYKIHLKHLDRLEKIFISRKWKIKGKKCGVLDALLADAISQLSLFSDDIINWEIALILVSQKLAYHKIACYGGLAHIAINLSYFPAATLLAISVQEEEDYIANNLNGIINAFLASHLEGFKP